jgi:hypothetical protein
MALEIKVLDYARPRSRARRRMPLPAASSALIAAILASPLVPSFNAGRPNQRRLWSRLP